MWQRQSSLPSLLERVWLGVGGVEWASRRLQIPWSVIPIAFAFYEWFCFFAAAVIASLLITQFAPVPDSLWPMRVLSMGLCAGATYVVIQFARGMYDCRTLLNPKLARGEVLAACSLAGVALLSATLWNAQVSLLLALFANFVLAYPLLVSARVQVGAVIRALSNKGMLAGKKVVVAGLRDELDTLEPSYVFLNFGFQEVDRLVLSENESLFHVSEATLAAIDRAIEAARRRHARAIFLALGTSKAEVIDAVRNRLGRTPLSVRLIPAASLRRIIDRNQCAGEICCWSIELRSSSQRVAQRIVKRAFDIAGAAAAIVLLSPVFAIVALLIRIDSPGPVFFRQRRSGFNEEIFVIYKFRTMKVLEDGDRIVQACCGDPRVTRVGRLLRRMSVDELPQLFNVLIGDMSLVGPRPHALAHDEEYKRLIAGYPYRLHVKPGMTGLAQIRGFRGETDQLAKMRGRVVFDIWYARHWSVALDLWIILRTPIELLKLKAY